MASPISGMGDSHDRPYKGDLGAGTSTWPPPVNSHRHFTKSFILLTHTYIHIHIYTHTHIHTHFGYT